MKTYINPFNQIIFTNKTNQYFQWGFGVLGFWGFGELLFGELLFGELLGWELMGGGLLEGSLCLPIRYYIANFDNIT